VRLTLVSWPLLGVIVVLAIQTLPTPLEATWRAPDERLAQYALLRRLPAGLRAEVWLGLPAGGSSLGRLVAIKTFFPPVPGLAHSALAEELALAARLVHPNIVRTLRIGCDRERHFSVSEYLEGTTLQSLLRRASVARTSIAAAAVARVLSGIVRAVCYAEQWTASPAAMVLVRQTIAADDIFVTFDGAVKLLGFKTRPEAAGRIATDPARDDSRVPAAIDALLSEHRTPELSRVLAASCSRGSYALQRVARALQRWQADVLGSDGRAELADLMAAMFPWTKLDQKTQLEVRLGEWMTARSARVPPAVERDEGSAPASGFRKVLP
jgi:serine/threonine protein kinase